MDRDGILSLIIEMLEESEGVTEDTVLVDLNEWDSMTALSLIALADDKFGKKLTPGKIKEFNLVKDIIDFLSE